MNLAAALCIIQFANFIWAYGEDGQCGHDNSCPQYEPCCSIHGFCGSTYLHCAPGHCLGGSCWPTPEPPANWIKSAVLTPQERNQIVKQLGNEDVTLTESEIGVYRKLKHIPLEDFGVYVRCIDPGVVALTYDDGPSPFTSELLDILDAEKIKVTFFILVRKLDPHIEPRWKENQQILRDIVKRGHLIGSHSYNHPNFIQIGSWATEQDMNRADSFFKDILGFCPRIMRPPEGYLKFITFD